MPKQPKSGTIDSKNMSIMTFFILQAKYFIKTNTYVKTKNELLECLQGINQEILNICINRKQLNSIKKNELETLYEKLINWTSQNIIL